MDISIDGVSETKTVGSTDKVFLQLIKPTNLSPQIIIPNSNPLNKPLGMVESKIGNGQWVTFLKICTPIIIIGANGGKNQRRGTNKIKQE